MTALNRAWTLPMRAMAILVAMVAIAVATQVLAPRHAAVPPANPPDTGVAGVPQPAVGDLDTGTGAGAATSDDVSRMKADTAFWSARYQKNHLDFVSATQWGMAEIALARATGDVTGYLRAQAAFDAALATFEANPTAVDYKASVLVSLHRFAAARDLATSVLAKRPNDPVALATLGDARLELGDLAGARQAYDAAAARSGTAAAILVRLGHLAFISGDTQTAIKDARAAVPASDAEGASGERAAFYRYQLADVLISTGDLAGAKAAYADAISQDPASFLAMSGLARVAAAEGRLDDAIKLLSGAIAIVPQPDFLARRADLYTLRAGPGDARRATDDMATVEAIAKLAGEAAGVYDRTLSLYLANHGLEPARAVKLAEDELAVRKDVYGYDAYAWALLADGRAADAAAAMSTARSFGTKDAKVYYHAGMIAAALGNRAEARSDLEAALALDPSFDPLQVQRARTTLAGL